MIYCVNYDGKHFIVEIEQMWVPFFVNRFIYTYETIWKEGRKEENGQTELDSAFLHLR